MTTGRWRLPWRSRRRAGLALLVWIAVLALALDPAPMVPIARGYHALCARFPALTFPGQHIPPQSLALVLLLMGITGSVGCVTGLREWLGTLRVTRHLRQLARPLPPRLVAAARQLTIEDRLTYLETPAPAALCYGLLRPRITLTSGLLQRLDDEELQAVLLHERHHLRRRDPLRYLLLHALASGLFLVPLTADLRHWAETRIELAADRAALAVVPRGALAGALMAALGASSLLPAGLAPLSATEARIAHLAGRTERSPVPYQAAIVSMALLVGLGLAIAWLARPEQAWELLCSLCPWLS